VKLHSHLAIFFSAYSSWAFNIPLKLAKSNDPPSPTPHVSVGSVTTILSWLSFYLCGLFSDWLLNTGPLELTHDLKLENLPASALCEGLQDTPFTKGNDHNGSEWASGSELKKAVW
jgi:hypothetical protein